MKSLTEDLRSNREQATKLMKDNNISRICFTDYDGDIDVPNVLLINKNDEPYETSVTDVKLCGEEIYINAVNMTDLCSNAYVDKEGYVNYFACAYYTANNVYLAIEDYFENGVYLEDKLKELAREIKQKFINLLTNEDEKSFTFKEYECFNVFAGIEKTTIKSIYMEDNNVYVETNEKTEKVPLSVIRLEKRCQLLKHLRYCLKYKC